MNKTIIYDFDGTITPYPLPKFKVLEQCGFEGGASNKEFLKMVNQRAKDKNIDIYLAFYEVTFDILKENGYKLTDETVSLGYGEVVYNRGVLEFLSNLRNMGVNNYLLSSGIKVFLEKLSIAPLFN